MEVQEEFGDQVVFIGVPGLSSDDDAKARFLEQTGAGSFDHVVDDGEIWDRFGVSGQRTYVYVNDDGQWSISGYGSLREGVEDLVAN